MTEPSLLGVMLGLVFYAISASPSLLPRRWWWHGFVSGPVTALGYTLGWGISNGIGFLARATGLRVTGPPELFFYVKWTAVVLVAAWVVYALVKAYRASREAALLVNIKPVGFGEYLLGLLATAVMFVITMALVYALTRIFVMVTDILGHWLPWFLSWTVAAVVAVGVVLVISNKVVFRLFMAYFAKAAAGLNARTNAHLSPPAVPERSGSPFSEASWESIGAQGRLFLGHGPSAQKISEVTGRPAIEPVRIYIGLPAGEKNIDRVVDEAVRELRRAGGFERAVLVVYTATGSGWVDEWVCQPLEYMTGGDCAIVTIQYSYLFSAAMMVSDRSACENAGTALFEAVESEVQKLPEDERPLVIVSGESLGAYGSQAPFSSAEELNRRTDGALWVGSPSISRLSSQLTENRQGGSPEVAPVVDSGHNIRFVNNPSQLDKDLYGRDLGPWNFPRSVFLQHASDPVVFYNTSLAFSEPDWLRERVGPDVSPEMRYTPLVTYLQVLTDLPVGGLAPAGHGHTYNRELLEVWIKLLALDEEQARGLVASGHWVTPSMKNRIADAIDADLANYHKGLKDPPPDES